MAKNPETRITFRAFNKDFNKAINEMKNESGKLRQEFKLQEAQMEGTASETDKLQAKLDYLGRAQDLAAQKVKATADQLQKAKAQFGENSTEAGKMERKLLDAQIAEQKLKNEIATTSAALQDQANTIKKTADAIGKAGDKMKEAGSTASTTVTPAIAGIGLAAGKVASDFDSAAARLKNSLGLTEEQTAQLTETARNIYTDGYGQSLSEVETAVIQTRQNIKGLNDEDLAGITTHAMLLADIFETDINEVTRAGSNVMQGFGVSAQEAFDLMGYGAQNGLNFSNEMFDNLSEYAPLFSNMGFSAQEYFQLLINGSQEGVYNLDYINDVMKEFQVRVKDGSKTTSDAMDQMSESTQKVWQNFLDGNGTVKDVSNAVLGELKGMDDQVAANQIGVDLFGTKWEDLESDAMYALGGIDGKLGDFKGTMDGMQATQEETFGQRFQSMIRELAVALEPLGEALLRLAEDWLPRISAAVSTLSGWFASLSPVIQTAVVIFGAIAAAIGPVLVVLGMIVQAIGALIPIVMQVIGWLGRLAPLFNILRSAIMVLAGPIGWISGAVIALAILIYTYWDQIVAYTKTAWSAVAQWLTTVWTNIKQIFSSSMEWIRTTSISIWNGIIAALQTAGQWIRQTFTAIWNGLVAVVMAVVQPIITTVLTYFNSMRAGIAQVFSGIQMVISNAWTIIKNVFLGAILIILDLITGNFGSIRGHFSQIMNNIRTAAVNIWNGIKSIFLGAVSAIRGYVTTGFNAMRSVVTSVMSTVRSFISSAWNTIRSAISSAASNIVSTVTSRFNAARSAIQNAMNTARSVVSNAWNNIKSVSTSAPQAIVSTVTSKFQALVSAARNKMNEVLSAIRNGWNQAKSFLSSIDLSQIGADIINGLVNGIKSKVGAVGEAIQSVAGSVKDKITGALGIKSPSRVMMEYGEFTTEGFAIGIERMKSMVQKAAQGLAIMAQPSTNTSSTGRSESLAAGQVARTIMHRTVLNLDGQAIADIVTPFVDENMQVSIDVDDMLRRV